MVRKIGSMESKEVYNRRPMARQVLLNPDIQPSLGLSPVDLFLRCAADRENRANWSEFLRRYASKIRHFIRGTLRKTFGSATDPGVARSRGGVQESDYLQNVIMRLVENDCAMMKRFSGTTEDELLAYLAVITRSVVIDTLRRQRVFSSRAGSPMVGPCDRSGSHIGLQETAEESDPEREVLVRELAFLTQRTIKTLSGPATSRDLLVFDLYFTQGLSFQQIAGCNGINLTKGGVEKLLNRLVHRVRMRAAAGSSEASCDEK